MDEPNALHGLHLALPDSLTERTEMKLVIESTAMTLEDHIMHLQKIVDAMRDHDTIPMERTFRHSEFKCETKGDLAWYAVVTGNESGDDYEVIRYCETIEEAESHCTEENGREVQELVVSYSQHYQNKDVTGGFWSR